MQVVHVLFVCLGNICRSPTAHGVFQQLVDNEGLSERIIVDSAGTAAFHIGRPPDSRSTFAASKRGYDLSPLIARQVHPQDFTKFDFILPMDRMNMGNLRAMCPKDYHGELKLFLDYAKDRHYAQVPDPYSGEEDGFELVLDLIEDAAQGLLDTIKRTKLNQVTA